MRAVKAAVQAFQAVLGPTADTLVGGVRVDCLGHKKGATLKTIYPCLCFEFFTNGSFDNVGKCTVRCV